MGYFAGLLICINLEERVDGTFFWSLYLLK